MAAGYWLFPQITGNRLRFRSLATVQPYLWFVGMTLMSNAMHRAGLAGIPRRTAEPQYGSVTFEGVVGGVSEMRIQIAIGGTLLFVALLLFLIVVFGTWLGGDGTDTIRVNGSIPAPLSGPEHSPKILDNLKLWTAVAIVLIVLAYGLPLSALVADGLFAPGSPPIPV
jgi:cytochrome c oxidase subunit 1